jgi:hypothetical protein
MHFLSVFSEETCESGSVEVLIGTTAGLEPGRHLAIVRPFELLRHEDVDWTTDDLSL